MQSIWFAAALVALLAAWVCCYLSIYYGKVRKNAVVKSGKMNVLFMFLFWVLSAGSGVAVCLMTGLSANTLKQGFGNPGHTLGWLAGTAAVWAIGWITILMIASPPAAPHPKQRH